MIHEFNFSIEDGKVIDSDILSMLAGLVLQNYEELAGELQESLRKRINGDDNEAEWKKLIDITFGNDEHLRHYDFGLSRLNVEAEYSSDQGLLVVRQYALAEAGSDLEVFTKEAFVIEGEDEALFASINYVQKALAAWLERPTAEPVATE